MCSPDSSPRPHRELICKPLDTSVLGEARKSDMGRNNLRDSRSVDRVQKHRTPKSQQGSLSIDCGADRDSEFTTAELLQPQGHLLLPPFSISAVQNYSQPTASNLSLINKTQHSLDKFLKLQSRQAASQAPGKGSVSLPIYNQSATHRQLHFQSSRQLQPPELPGGAPTCPRPDQVVSSL